MDLNRRGQRLRRLSGAGAALVLALSTLSACGASGEGAVDSTVPPVPTTEIVTSTSTTAVEPTSTTQTPTPTTEVVVSSTTTSTAPTTTLPQPTIPTGSIPEDDEATACEAIQERLAEYQALAESAGPGGLVSLQLGLEEFENEVDFISQQQDWGLQMLEQLYQVRREWSTAYAAYEAGDEAAANEHFAAATEYMNAALAVPCP